MLRLLSFLCAVCLAVPALHAQGMARSIPEPAFPPLGRPWSLSDVNRAAVVLHRMGQYHPEQLPHYSIGSRSLFGRLTAPGVLDVPDTAGVATRQTQGTRAVRLYEQILLIYARAHARQGAYDVEVAELAGVLLATTAATTRPLDELLAADATPGAAAFRADLEAMMTGVLAMVGNADVLSEEARGRLLHYAVQYAAPIAAALSSESRAALAARVDGLLLRRELVPLRDDLEALRAHYARP